VKQAHSNPFLEPTSTK